MRPLLAAAVLMILVACGRSAAPPAVDTLVAQSIEHLSSTEGFTFRIARDGEAVELGGWLVRGLSGEFQAPDAVNSRVKVSVSGLIVEVGVVSIGDTTWQQDPLSGQWLQLDPATAVTVAPVFGPDGLVAVMRSDISQATYVETVELDDLPGEDLFHLSAQLDTTRLSGISAGLIADGETPADFYFAENGELRRVVIPDATGAWLIDAWAYGPGHVVEPPG